MKALLSFLGLGMTCLGLAQLEHLSHEASRQSILDEIHRRVAGP